MAAVKPSGDASLSPSKKSTDASMWSSMSGPKLRCLSPGQKRTARLQVLELQLKAVRLFGEERRLDWQLKREVKVHFAAQFRREELCEIEYRQQVRCHSAKVDSLVQQSARQLQSRELLLRHSVAKEAKQTLRLRQLQATQDDLSRSFDQSQFLYRVQSQRCLDKRRDRDEAYASFVEKIAVFQTARKQEEVRERAEREYRDSRNAVQAVDEAKQLCRAVEQRLETVKSAV